MKKEKLNKTTREQIDKGNDTLPGVAVNTADSDKVDPCLVRERTRTLNNNPRNDD